MKKTNIVKNEEDIFYLTKLLKTVLLILTCNFYHTKTSQMRATRLLNYLLWTVITS